MKILQILALLLLLHQSVTSQTLPCDSIPPLNQAILDYVETEMGKKVGSGQCWDFADAALRLVGAEWDRRYKFGKLIDSDKECVYAGDIMQFEGVQINYEQDGGHWQESMGHHTAIIYKVNASGDYELSHQNFGPSKKRVNVTNLKLKNITKGKFYIYRPVRQ